MWLLPAHGCTCCCDLLELLSVATLAGGCLLYGQNTRLTFESVLSLRGCHMYEHLLYLTVVGQMQCLLLKGNPYTALPCHLQRVGHISCFHLLFTFSSPLCPSTASVLVQVEPVGRWFEAYVRRRNRNVSASFQELEDEEESSEESEDEEFQLEEYPILRTLDPKDWKVPERTSKMLISSLSLLFFLW